MIAVRFDCGHEAQISETATQAPQCHCGSTRVVYVKARAPRFTGACTGPYAEYKALEPGSVDLTTAGPLTLKESGHAE